MALRQGQHVWVRHGQEDWAESVILTVESPEWVWVQEMGTERNERTHASRVFEFRPGV
jgi:hypothetical protein